MIFKGTVIKGDGRGKFLGFPTANLWVKNTLKLPQGIFAAWTYIDDKRYPSALFIGVREMFGDSAISVETHLIDFDGDLYDRELKIEIVILIRENKYFRNIHLLIEQIEKDIELIKHELK